MKPFIERFMKKIIRTKNNCRNIKPLFLIMNQKNTF